MEEEVKEEYKAAATVDSRRACPSGCPRAVRGGVTATRRQAALGISTSGPQILIRGYKLQLHAITYAGLLVTGC